MFSTRLIAQATTVRTVHHLFNMPTPKVSVSVSNEIPKGGFNAGVVEAWRVDKRSRKGAFKILATQAASVKAIPKAILETIACGEGTLASLSVDDGLAWIAARTGLDVEQVSATFRFGAPNALLTRAITPAIVLLCGLSRLKKMKAGSIPKLVFPVSEPDEEGKSDESESELGDKHADDEIDAAASLSALEALAVGLTAQGFKVPAPLQKKLDLARAALNPVAKAAPEGTKLGKATQQLALAALSDHALEAERQRTAAAIDVLLSSGTATPEPVSARLFALKEEIRRRHTLDSESGDADGDSHGDGDVGHPAKRWKEGGFESEVMEQMRLLQAQVASAAVGAKAKPRAAVIEDRIVKGGRVSVGAYQSSGRLGSADHEKACKREFICFTAASKRCAGSASALANSSSRNVLATFDESDGSFTLADGGAATRDGGAGADKTLDHPVFWIVFRGWMQARLQTDPELESEFRAYEDNLRRMHVSYRTGIGEFAYQRYDTAFRRAAAGIEMSVLADGAPAIADWASEDPRLARDVISTASFSSLDSPTRAAKRPAMDDRLSDGKADKKKPKSGKSGKSGKAGGATCHAFNADGECQFKARC